MAKNVLRKTWLGGSRLGSRANLVEFDVVGSSAWESSRGAFSSSLSEGSDGLSWSSAVREEGSAEGRSASDSSMNMRSQSKKPAEEFCDGSICRGKRLHWRGNWEWLGTEKLRNKILIAYQNIENELE